MGVIESGGYFGELALLTKQPRAASIATVAPTTVLSIDRKAFTNTLGPLHNILKRKANKYESYLNEEFSALGLEDDDQDDE
jgi:cAMP-dependent protein kinase regulator